MNGELATGEAWRSAEAAQHLLRALLLDGTVTHLTSDRDRHFATR